ncbi:YidH family protein [Maridesulfovibrio hydrothermalis]|uniref:DUF202 domain-containing protein n=1 Tax=Maridesulfovibrio hydrothermalis AM13 = DSM 14728 TaxID=1121451 RepID=L0R8T1_9BACT|nr:DUF202 domain-containing protein [Maridesulfovibrio hydrothermalis]CCO22637.1 conserved membrane protein of unknown function [Maridesulfovibrio hydrothermalis AM13 = DSM 14728]
MTDESKEHIHLDNNQLAKIRTLLANERTFLAWCRTSLGLLGFGFLIEKVGLYMKKFLTDVPVSVIEDMTWLSLFTLSSGMVILVGAAVRFFYFERKIGSKIKWATPYPELLVTLTVGLIFIISALASKMML